MRNYMILLNLKRYCMKRILSLTVAAALLVSALCGCVAAQGGDGLSIVCTVYPVYDWLKQICADNASITLIGANGSDVHSYQPTAADIASIAAADLTVVIGAESDAWVSEAADKNSKGEKIELTEAVKEDLLLLGEHHDHTGEHSANEYDEHVWLSPRLAQKICRRLTEKIIALDSNSSELYKSNSDAYLQRLAELDGEFSSAVADAENKTLVFADRYPFRYLMEDYGLSCHSAYDGCSAEASADFSTVTRLSAVITENRLSKVVIIDGSTDALAKSIISASGCSCDILTLDSMQSTAPEELELTDGYISIMRSNIAVIKTALER